MQPLFGLTNDDVKTIGSGATTIGVLLALFTPSLSRWWRSPLLSLEYDASGAAPHWDHVGLEESFFLRARVRNASGCNAAEAAQVLVSSFRASDLGLDGRALEWSGQRAQGELPVTTIRLPPGLHRHIDILQITPTVDGNVGAPHSQESARSGTRQFRARLCVHPKPWGDAHLVPQGDFDVVVSITAANADTISYRFTVSYDGDFSARLSAPPQRAHHRSPARAVRRAAKWALGDFRT